MPPAAPIESVIADVAVLRRSFASAGLLDATPAAAAAALAGGTAGAAHLRRDLLLADALLRNRVAPRPVPGRPRHVVVFGGTKVGKSSVVNILAKAPLAATSPEGGFTRLAWAFVAGRTDPLATRPLAFRDFARVPPEQAAGDRFDLFCVAPRTGSTLPNDMVLWDTPDCDSVGAERYLPALIEALSLADLVVYVTSIEKYSVAALVEWVFDLHAAGLDLVECLNKTPARDRPAVIRRQQEDIFPRMADERNAPAPTLPIVALRFMVEGAEADLWNGTLHPEADDLRAAVLRRLDAERHVDARKAAADAALRLGRVLDIVQQSRSASAAWQAAMRDALTGFVRRYEAEYLTSGKVIEPFSRLNIEIMRLLDLDTQRLNAVLAAFRRFNPARLATEAALAVLRGLAGRTSSPDSLPPQARAFTDAHTDLLNELGRTIDRARRVQPHHPFWDDLGIAWDAALPGLHQAFAARLAGQLENTEVEIRAAAENIVTELRKRPVLLHALKGTRIAVRAGALLAGFFVPHVGMVQDLLQEVVIAPLLLETSERSADWLVGAYVDQRRRALIAKLGQDATRFAETIYWAPLHALAGTATGIDLPDDLPERLAADLQRLQSSLDMAPA